MPEISEVREWTVMFYFASDNPLAPGTISQLKAIKNAGFHREVNVIAQFDPHTINMPVHIFDVNMVEKLSPRKDTDTGFNSKDPFVRNLVLDKLWDENIKKDIQEQLNRDGNGHNGTPPREKYDPPVPKITMSSEQDPKTSLAEFLEFCRIHYPARHYMLIILAHGVVVGNDLFMLDEHGASGESPQRTLKLTDLREVLDTFDHKITGDKPSAKLELIGFHSCSMSAAEVAFELRGRANYMLAAEGPQFVGSWPYRQMLIRLFNEVENSKPLSNHSIARAIVNTVKTDISADANVFRKALNRNGGKELLERHNPGDSPDLELINTLADEVKTLLKRPSFCEDINNGRALSSRMKRRKTKHLADPLTGKHLIEFNRELISEAFPEDIQKVKIRRMFINFFDFCMYNSFDFQLAGYSSELTLCDLNRVDQLQEPLATLATTLIEALASSAPAADSPVRNAILLAHWESQSYYEENYTDLYDFCFRLAAKYQTIQPTQPIFERIVAACNGVMDALKRGVHKNDFGAIVRCKFCGPTYQYSHGLSIFFPWSEPVGNLMWDEEYERYELSDRTKWRDFLKTYFTNTMRQTKEKECDERELELRDIREGLDGKLLGLIEHMASEAFADAEQLAKGGARDPLGEPRKGGATDPTGGGCECNSIKNHPRRSRTRPNLAADNIEAAGENGHFIAPASETIIAGLSDQFHGRTEQADEFVES